MKSQSWLKILLVTMMFALVLAGCGGQSTEAPAEEEAAPAAQEEAPAAAGDSNLIVVITLWIWFMMTMPTSKTNCLTPPLLVAQRPLFWTMPEPMPR